VKRMLYGLFVWTLTFAVIPAYAEEFRGVWLRPPADTSEIPAMLDGIAEAGFNAVLVETFYHGFTISATSPVPTRPEYAGQDVLQQFIEEGHRRGLEVHAWVEVFYWEVNIEQYPQFPRTPLFEGHPDWVLKLKGGRETWESEPAHRFANPAHPEVRAFLLQYFEDLLRRYELDGLNLDYIRYSGGAEDAGYDAFTIQKFQAEQGFDPSEIAQADAERWKLWVEWREGQVTDLVRQVRHMHQNTRPGAMLSAAIFPGYYRTRYKGHFIFQDWATWAEEDLVDSLMPMAYGGTLVAVRREIVEVQNHCPPSTPILPGLAIERRKKDEFSGEGHPPIADQIALVRSAALPGHVTFCYDWILDSEEGLKAYRDGPYKAGKSRLR